MRAPLAVAVACALTAATFVGFEPSAGLSAHHPTLGRPAHAAHARARMALARGASAGRFAPAARGKIAVQPVDGPSNTAPVRALIARIVRGRGYRTMTTLPRYEGTAQYPGLARDHRLAAFVTADVEERGKWQRITFLVWNGATGSVLGRWTASAQASALARTVGRGFWAHLGPAVMKAAAPPSDRLEAAPTMRIDASEEASNDDAHGPRSPVAQR